MHRTRRGRSMDGGGDGVIQRQAAPGKTTLTQRLAAAPRADRAPLPDVMQLLLGGDLQRSNGGVTAAAGGATPELSTAARAASDTVRGQAGGTLPFAEQIQESFGRHDIT